MLNLLKEIINFLANQLFFKFFRNSSAHFGMNTPKIKHTEFCGGSTGFFHSNSVRFRYDVFSLQESAVVIVLITFFVRRQ